MITITRTLQIGSKTITNTVTAPSSAEALETLGKINPMIYTGDRIGPLGLVSEKGHFSTLDVESLVGKQN